MQTVENMQSSGNIANAMLCDVDNEILNLIRSKHHLSGWQNEPFSIGDKTAATNGWSLVVINKKSEWKDMIDKVKSVYPIEIGELKELQISEILRAINEVPLIDCFDETEADCDACDGSGVVDYEFSYKGKSYEVEEDCPICDGDGKTLKISHIPNGKMEIDLSKHVLLEGVGLNIERLQDLLKIAELRGVSVIKYSIGLLPTKPIYFQISDDTELILMPVFSNSDDVAPNIA